MRIVSPTATVIYSYDGDNVIEELDGSGSATAQYTQGLGIDEPLEVSIGHGTYYYHADGLGSITELTKSNGTAVNTYTYAAFGGDSPANSETVANPFHFTAREWDSETKLYYYRARYYDPLFGRFLSEDPVGFASGQFNLYEYVGNSPVIQIDPMGLATCLLVLDGEAQTGYMMCAPDDPRGVPLAFPAASGNNAGGSHCKNDPACAADKGRGPIPLGFWQWTNRPNSKGVRAADPSSRFPALVQIGLRAAPES